MDYKKLIEALVCNDSEDEADNLGCSNQRCKYRDVDGACDIVKMCTDAAAAITKLLERAEKAERQVGELFHTLNDVCKDIRERTVEDYVCGFCEYDGACIGESGEWLNECPGFEKDDCFCMKKSIREKYGQLED